MRVSLVISRSENMRRIKSTGSAPEMALRRLVHALGYRYRLHRHDLPGRPDLVFVGRKKVIFMHGCFWHQHPRCKLSHIPRSNKAYWGPKLKRNMVRDKKNRSELGRLGWQSLVLWECQVSEAAKVSRVVRSFLR